VLALVGVAFFMTILDVSIVNVALPSIGRALDFSRGDLQWVVTAYAIAFGGFLMLGGRAADLLGRRRVFMVGVALFTLASLVCGLAESEATLIAARAVQGLGGAIISPAALSIVMTSFEEGAERNKALGIWGALGGSGAAVGVLAGGALTEVGWEWIFFVNVPVGAAVFALTPRIVRESRRVTERRRYDPLGAVSVTAGLALLVFTISKAPEIGWGTARTILLLLAAIALLVAFVAIEWTGEEPLMPFRIFRVRTVAGANVVGVLLGAVVFANFFVLHASERLPGTVDAELVLVGEDDLELEPGQAEERGDADEPAEDVLDAAAARRAAGGEDLALVREPDNPAPHRHRRDKPYRMLLREQLELAPQGCKAAGLDLDQQVAADEVDDETAGELLEQVAGTAVPFLQLRVERALVERPDLHDDAPSAPVPRCLRPQ
jgi:MFS family permease